MPGRHCINTAHTAQSDDLARTASTDIQWFAIDIAGGERAASTLLKGCRKALKKFPALGLLLFGDENEIGPWLEEYRRFAPRVRIIHCPVVISMEDDPVRAPLRKRDASLSRAIRSLASGKAFGLFTPGNTGAVITAAVHELGLFPGLDRPALATTLPTVDGDTLLIDSGANPDVSPDLFLQFACLGYGYLKTALRKERCRIGLLNIGKESHKGNRNVRNAYRLLQEKAPCFAGNVEGDEVFTGKFDVVLCDGFVGNIIIKLSEQLGKETFKLVRSRLNKQDFRKLFNRTGQKMRGLWNLSGKIMSRAMRRIIDSERHGGVPLLGVQGMVLVGHGKARGKAVYNAIRKGLAYHKQRLIENMATIWREQLENLQREQDQDFFTLS